MTGNHLRFFRTADGSPRASGDSESDRVLARFLESDIQDDPVTARELLTRLEAPIAEDGHADAFVGNAFALTRDGDTVTLAGHAEGNIESAMLDLESTKQAVSDWLSFVSE